MNTVAEQFDVIVIGGGAAGLMAAGRAAERGRRVLLLEKNAQLGKKLGITGGGRCNITNAEEDVKVLLSHYGAAEPYLYSAFSQFGVLETFAFFAARGLPIIVEARKRAFPETQRASDVVRVLADYVKAGAVMVRFNAVVREVTVANGMVDSVVTDAGVYRAASYVFATGGVSHPETGSTGDGFPWLRAMGHTIKDPTPTIVPLKVLEEWVRPLAGKVLPGARVTFYQDGLKAFTVTGDILLTHFGLSGPTILNAAGRVADLLHEGSVTARLDLFPGHDIGQLDARILAAFDGNKNKQLQNVAREFLPPGTAAGLLALIPDLDPEKKAHSITKAERRLLVDTIKALPVTIEGLMGYERAVVADGGVPLQEMDMRTMRSLRAGNAFIIGDLLHITRPSGGYSLQLCWTSGYVAGNQA